MQAGSWRATNESSTQRGYGYRWQQAREGYLRHHPLCVMCLELDNLPVPATVVDHKTPHRGDMTLFWDSKNWQSLCAHHHSSTKQRQEAADLAAGSHGDGPQGRDQGSGQR